MKSTVTIIALLFTINTIMAKNIPLNNIRGTVVNYKTGQSIVGANVLLVGKKLGARTSSDGSFVISDVPIGRYEVKVSSVGYNPDMSSIVLSSGKELILKVKLNESFSETDEIKVVGSRGYFTPINEAIIVSATEFTLEETQRYAGSRGDPARMAQNFAGVLGVDDNRNDIIIRGGSPTELLWRIDGMDISNPNHFGTQGATGGPVSAINPALLDDSEFMTGGFPAEYGGKISGVFDLKTRKGNNENFEFLGQVGFNGVEFGAEGPISEKSSFIANYRYSALGFMDAIGIDFGFVGIPQYQDATIKYDWSITDDDIISFTNIYSKSSITQMFSEVKEVKTGDRDVNSGDVLYAGILNWKHLFSEKLVGKALLGYTYNKYYNQLDSISTDGNNNVTDLTKWYNNNSTEEFLSLKYDLSYLYSRHSDFTFGAEARYMDFYYIAQRYTMSSGDKKLYYINADTATMHYQTYVNWNYKISDNIISNTGLFSQYNGISKEMSIEPRFAISWELTAGHILNAAIGRFTQEQPLVLYYSHPTNTSLRFTKSTHYIVGYQYQPEFNWLFKAEGFFKDIYDAPVQADIMGAWSFLNAGTKFGSVVDGQKAVSNGLGKTYGLELSLLKSFSNGWYMTATATLLHQEYKGSDEVWRNGAFDNRYIFNILGGYEWIISNNQTLEFSVKYTHANGSPYTPINIEKSREKQGTYRDYSETFSMRNDDYKKLDIKIDFRQNFTDWAIISYFSIENVLNTENILYRYYDVNNDRVNKVNQLGLFPIGGVRFEF